MSLKTNIMNRKFLTVLALLFLVINSFADDPYYNNHPCDLIITDVSWIPENPIDGEPVVFFATIKNIGTHESPPGVIHGVMWKLNHGTVNWSDYHIETIKPGESVILKPSGGEGYIAVEGVHTLSVFVDPDWDINRIAETNKDNNSYTTQLRVRRADGKMSHKEPNAPLIPSDSIKLTSIDVGGYGNINSSMGSTIVVEEGKAYTITSKGHEIAMHSACDWHHFAYVPLEGDFDIRVRVDEIVAPFSNNDATAALVARESLDGSARIIHLKAFVPGSLEGNGSFGGRKVVGGNMFSGKDKVFGTGGVIGIKGNPVWLRIQRIDNRFFGYYSHNGTSWTSLNSLTADMPQTMYVGIAASPNEFYIPVTARFSDLKVYGVLSGDATSIFTKGLGTGLTAEYYNGRSFDEHLFTRIDSVIDFQFKYGDPVDLRMGYENYSVRWSGFLEPQNTGWHKVHLVVDDGVRVWIDNKLVIDSWKDQAPIGLSHELELKEGLKYPIIIEYFDGKIGGLARLLWESENMPMQRIPASQLYPKKIPAIPYIAQVQTEKIPLIARTGWRCFTKVELLGSANIVISPFSTYGRALEIPASEGAGLKWTGIDGGNGGIHYFNIIYNTQEHSWLECSKNIYVNGKLIDKYHFFPEGVRSYYLKVELRPGKQNSIEIKHDSNSKGAVFIDLLGIDNDLPVLPLAPAIYRSFPVH
jgi:hypothetical protein